MSNDTDSSDTENGRSESESDTDGEYRDFKSTVPLSLLGHIKEEIKETRTIVLPPDNNSIASYNYLLSAILQFTEAKKTVTRGKKAEEVVMYKNLDSSCKFVFKFFKNLSEDTTGHEGGGARVWDRLLLILEKSGNLSEELWRFTHQSEGGVMGKNQASLEQATGIPKYNPLNWKNLREKRFLEESGNESKSDSNIEVGEEFQSPSGVQSGSSTPPRTMKSDILITLMGALYAYPFLSESVVNSFLLTETQFNNCFKDFDNQIVFSCRGGSGSSTSSSSSSSSSSKGIGSTTTSSSSSRSSSSKTTTVSGMKRKAGVSVGKSSIETTSEVIAKANTLKKSVLQNFKQVVPSKQFYFTDVQLAKVIQDYMNPECKGYNDAPKKEVLTSVDVALNNLEVCVNEFCAQPFPPTIEWRKNKEGTDATSGQKNPNSATVVKYHAQLDRIRLAYNRAVEEDSPSDESKVSFESRRNAIIFKFLYHCSRVKDYDMVYINKGVKGSSAEVTDFYKKIVDEAATFK